MLQPQRCGDQRTKNTCAPTLDTDPDCYSNKSTVGFSHLQLQQQFILTRSCRRVMIKMQQSTCQEDRVYVGCVRVFLAPMTAHGFESIHILKWNPGCRTRPLVAAKVLTSASLRLLLRYSRFFYKLLLIQQNWSPWGSETLACKEERKNTPTNVATLNSLKPNVMVNAIDDIKWGPICGAQPSDMQKRKRLKVNI